MNKTITIKVTTTKGLVLTNCLLLNKIDEGKKSLIYSCKCNLDNPNNYQLIKNTDKEVNKEYLIKISKIQCYNTLKDYSYLHQHKNFTDLLISGVTNIRNINFDYPTDPDFRTFRCLIMNKINGINLNTFLNRLINDKINYSFNELLILFYKINNKINIMHNNYVFHNDLRSHNIIIDYYYNPSLIEVNIIDFGESLCYYGNKLSRYFIDCEINKVLDNNKYAKINGIYYANNLFLIRNKLTDEYINNFKMIDKFTIFIDIFKSYYFNKLRNQKLENIKQNSQVINDINKLFESEFNISSKLLSFIFDFNICNRLPIPLFMLLLHNKHILNPVVENHIKKLYNVIINNKNLSLLKKNRNRNIKKLFNQCKNNKDIEDDDMLMIMLIYYSMVIFNKKDNETVNKKFFIKYDNLISFFNKLIDDKLNVLISNYYQVTDKNLILCCTKYEVEYCICEILNQLDKFI